MFLVNVYSAAMKETFCMLFVAQTFQEAFCTVWMRTYESVRVDIGWGGPGDWG